MKGDSFFPRNGARSSQPRGARTIDLIRPAARLLSPGVATTDGHASRIFASPSCGGTTPVTGVWASRRGPRVGLLGVTAAESEGLEFGDAANPVGGWSCSISFGTRVTETTRPAPGQWTRGPSHLFIQSARRPAKGDAPRARLGYEAGVPVY